MCTLFIIRSQKILLLLLTKFLLLYYYVKINQDFFQLYVLIVVIRQKKINQVMVTISFVSFWILTFFELGHIGKLISFNASYKYNKTEYK